MTKNEATNALLRIVTARTYIGEEVFINDECKFAFRPSTSLEAAYQRGRFIIRHKPTGKEAVIVGHGPHTGGTPAEAAPCCFEWFNTDKGH